MVVGFAIYRVYLDTHDACGLDNGGSWSIGMAYGTSPFDLRLSKQPALTCSNVKDLPAGMLLGLVMNKLCCSERMASG